MFSKYDITKEQLDGIVAFVNKEEGAVLDPDAAQAFLGVAAALGTALVRDNRRLRSENLGKSRRLERIAERKRRDQKEMVEKNAFEGTGLDSVDVAKAALYCLQQTGVKMSKNKLMLILYMAYCSYLYNENKRVFIEGPVALVGGPVFWNVTRKISSVVTPVGIDAWYKLTAQSPAVAKFIKNYMAKYCDHSESDLKRFVVNSAPCRTALEAARGKDRKSFEINDKDIWIWRDSLKK